MCREHAARARAVECEQKSHINDFKSLICDAKKSCIKKWPKKTEERVGLGPRAPETCLTIHDYHAGGGAGSGGHVGRAAVQGPPKPV